MTLETLSSIIACLAHDVGHPALTNRFLIQNRDDLAIQYNDSSVLENMHAYSTFHLLSLPGSNILSNLAGEDWIKLRKIVIELILDTDMSRHFEILGRFRARTSNLVDFGLDNIDNKIIVLSMAVKCADLGHSGKRLELHERWTALICEEFFRQGDLEKERRQEISMYCDRFNTDVPKSQAGFIRNICLPLYETWTTYLKVDKIKVACLDQMKTNLEYWTRKGKKENFNED
jgi:3',5'-cyclic-nucleotide phosphodiesterase/cAMP-specific phosphodiesterase 4